MNENIITYVCTKDVKVGDLVSMQQMLFGKTSKIVCPAQNGDDIVGQVLRVKNGFAVIQTQGCCVPIKSPETLLKCKAMVSRGHHKGDWVEGYYVQIKPHKCCSMDQTHYIYTGEAFCYPAYYPIDISTLHKIFK